MTLDMCLRASALQMTSSPTLLINKCDHSKEPQPIQRGLEVLWILYSKLSVNQGVDLRFRALFNCLSKVILNELLSWFFFTLPCDWSRKLPQPSQPTKCKTKPNINLVAFL